MICENRTNSGKYAFLNSQPAAGLKMEILKMPFLIKRKDFVLGTKLCNTSIRYPKKQFGLQAMQMEERQQAWVNKRYRITNHPNLAG